MGRAIKRVGQGDVLGETGDLPMAGYEFKSPIFLGFGNFEILQDSWHRLQMQNSHDIVHNILREYGITDYTNKDIVALNGVDGFDCDIAAIYSHDNTTLGLLTLRQYLV